LQSKPKCCCCSTCDPEPERSGILTQRSCNKKKPRWSGVFC